MLYLCAGVIRAIRGFCCFFVSGIKRHSVCDEGQQRHTEPRTEQCETGEKQREKHARKRSRVRKAEDRDLSTPRHFAVCLFVFGKPPCETFFATCFWSSKSASGICVSFVTPVAAICERRDRRLLNEEKERLETEKCQANNACCCWVLLETMRRKASAVRIHLLQALVSGCIRATDLLRFPFCPLFLFAPFPHTQWRRNARLFTRAKSS